MNVQRVLIKNVLKNHQNKCLLLRSLYLNVLLSQLIKHNNNLIKINQHICLNPRNKSSKHHHSNNNN